MKIKQKVTIGISAHNEASRIGQVLSDLQSQTQQGWNLEEVRVYCDGCTDLTALIVKKSNWLKVVVIDDRHRKGKTARLQQLFLEARGDLIVMFDADIRIMDTRVINKLVEPFLEGDVALTGGNSRPFKPKTFFEKAVYSSFKVFDSSRHWFKGGNNIFGCTGSCLAIRGSIAKDIRFPLKLINEDAYLYFYCTERGLFRYCEGAIVEYSLPKNTKDYIRQVIRSEPRAVGQELAKYYQDRVKNELNRPLLPYIQHVISVWLKNPIGVTYLFIINVVCATFFKGVLKNYDLNWFTAQSTKEIQNHD